MKITIFTPTYNRGSYLERLYISLTNQSNKSFKWIIVDDGSVDNTEKIVEKFISDKEIKIEYYKQKNSGKHIAHNMGVILCDTELFFCVDSDDYLPDQAIEIILKQWENKNNNINYSGVVALKGYSNTEVMGNRMPKNIYSSTLSDLYNIHRKKGEMSLIFKTEYLKDNLFPCFDGERFLSEEVVYNEIDNIAPLIVLNEIVYIMEYLEDGLTNNYIEQWKSCPQGVICLLQSRYKTAIKIKGVKKYYVSIKALLLLNAFCINKGLNIVENSPNKLISRVLFPISFLIAYLKFK